VLTLLVCAHETHSAATRSEIMRHRVVAQYPRRSGAQRHLLELLGEGALARESAHEAIGLAMLALAAKRSARLRESLLVAELLLLQHNNNYSILVPDSDDDDDDGDKRAERCCATIEHFWARSGDVFAGADASLAPVAQTLEWLASLWTYELDQLEIPNQ
jgi:hypothetical protein